MQRTTTERNLKLPDLHDDALKHLLQFLSPADLISLHATNHRFKNLVADFLTYKENNKIRKQCGRLFHRAQSHELNDYIDELNNTSNNTLKNILLMSASAAAVLSLSLMMKDLVILRNTLLAISAFLLTAAIVIGVRYFIINRQIDHTYHQINRLDDVEAANSRRIR